MNIALLRPDSPYGHAGEDGKFTRGEIQTALFSNESLTADMLLPELLAACDATPQRTIEDTPVNLTQACNVLAAWDRRFNSESVALCCSENGSRSTPQTKRHLAHRCFNSRLIPWKPLPRPPDLPIPTSRSTDLLVQYYYLKVRTLVSIRRWAICKLDTGLIANTRSWRQPARGHCQPANEYQRG